MRIGRIDVGLVFVLAAAAVFAVGLVAGSADHLTTAAAGLAGAVVGMALVGLIRDPVQPPPYRPCPTYDEAHPRKT